MSVLSRVHARARAHVHARLRAWGDVWWRERFVVRGLATFSMPISRMSKTPDSGMPSMGLPSASVIPQSFLCTLVPEG